MTRILRFLCPALCRSFRTPDASRRRDPLIRNIEKLEAYIKDVRKDVRNQAQRSQMEQQADTVNEEEINQFYQTLSSPSLPTLSAPRTLLPPSLCRFLQIEPDAAAAVRAVNWDTLVGGLIENAKIQSLTVFDINNILRAMPHDARVRAGRQLLDNMTTLRPPDRMTYDLLMDSYASKAQVFEALALFDRSRNAGLAPTVYSYAHLMKAFAITANLPKAMVLYEHMQEQGIEPNLVIHTSLMATCVRCGKIDQAFAVFDALKYKSLSSAPDAQTYSLMIHACSRDPTRSAERATDLFAEMTERGLVPTRETFNALIHVLAKRKEYFLEAWQVSESMQRNAVAMDKTTWHSLLSACVTSRDLPRARTLVREMFRLAETDRAWAPDATTFQTLFRAYASARVRRSFTPKNVLDTTATITTGERGPLLWVEEEPFSSDALLQESANMMAYLQTHAPHLLNTQLLDTYMTIATQFEASTRFAQDWSHLYAVHAKNRYSYQIALSATYTFRDYDLLQQVWTERTAWRASLEPNTSSPDAHGDAAATKMYIASLSRLNRVQQATRVLEEARRHVTFTKADLKCFQTKSLEVGDEDAVLLYREMFPEEVEQGRQRGRGAQRARHRYHS